MELGALICDRGRRVLRRGTERARARRGERDEDAVPEAVMPSRLCSDMKPAAQGPRGAASATRTRCRSWSCRRTCRSRRLKEVHVERLMQQAVARSERPWLILLSALSALSAALLAFVLLKLTSVLR